YSVEKAADRSGLAAERVAGVAREFATAKPSLALSGNPANYQANGVFNAIAVNILNYLVGNIGAEGGVRFNPAPVFPDVVEKAISREELRALGKSMRAGEVKALLLYNTNPAFTLAGNKDFMAGLKNVPLIVSFSSFMDESAELADLILPDSTYLESWGDYIPVVGNGKRSIALMQPVVSPLYNTHQIGDAVLALGKILGGEVSRAMPWNNFLDYLKSSWRGFYQDSAAKEIATEASFEAFWTDLLERGGWSGGNATFDENLPVSLPKPDLLSSVPFSEPKPLDKEDFHLHLYPSHGLYDGGNANQPWLQQLPEPLVTATWGTWAEINPKTAREMGVSEGDVLKISSEAGSIEVPAYIYPAIEPKTIAVPIGQGHTSFGSYAKNRGSNPLVLADSPAWASVNVKVAKTRDKSEVIKTEPGVAQPGIEDGVRELDRKIVQWVTPEEARALEGKELEPIKALPSRDLKKPSLIWSLLGLGKYRTSNTSTRKFDYRWGMAIDLDKCTGCGACMVACYAENNLPLVSAEEMARRRHKNWIRIERYWEGQYPDVRAKFIPVNCPQCANAPCEAVCPVYASYGADDGLNGQVYQRCIGTRYCNVNCPYRSRLFNWFNPEWPKPLDQQLNPDISVRTASIADKCTFCVQRIREAKEKAKDEGRKVRDGEIKPACAQTCPTGAITFGDLLDLKTEVSRLSKNARRYRLLEELNTEPAVIYLKAVKKNV
ncbi:MAG: 4Fe-4S dicluster domain-containing protein, partial [Chloroflexi bacterium]|nr:4Fe-4S dicluster domain-containing protein [Chloroflexota bacterium]